MCEKDRSGGGRGEGGKVHCIKPAASLWAMGVMTMLVMDNEPLWNLFVDNECDPQMLTEVLTVRT